ncbi:MAG: hypothetical protein K2N74_03980 [Clostridiales bacterium]|nr:hypothetical protein [Clostridiales bacterium]
MKITFNKKDLTKQKGITEISVEEHPQLGEEQCQHLNRLLAEIITKGDNNAKAE